MAWLVMSGIGFTLSGLWLAAFLLKPVGDTSVTRRRHVGDTSVTENHVLQSSGNVGGRTPYG